MARFKALECTLLTSTRAKLYVLAFEFKSIYASGPCATDLDCVSLHRFVVIVGSATSALSNLDPGGAERRERIGRIALFMQVRSRYPSDSNPIPNRTADEWLRTPESFSD